MSANKIRRAGKFISKGKLNRINALETSASGEDSETFQIRATAINQKTFNPYIKPEGPINPISSRRTGVQKKRKSTDR